MHPWKTSTIPDVGQFLYLKTHTGPAFSMRSKTLMRPAFDRKAAEGCCTPFWVTLEPLLKFALQLDDVIRYSHVHSLHHKSYITGPWSGLAMHPVEHLFYYSCTLLTMVFSLHPFHFWMNKLHADISPLPGHDGHDKPVTMLAHPPLGFIV